MNYQLTLIINEVFTIFAFYHFFKLIKHRSLRAHIFCTMHKRSSFALDIEFLWAFLQLAAHHFLKIMTNAILLRVFLIAKKWSIYWLAPKQQRLLKLLAMEKKGLNVHIVYFKSKIIKFQQLSILVKDFSTIFLIELSFLCILPSINIFHYFPADSSQVSQSSSFDKTSQATQSIL